VTDRPYFSIGEVLGLLLEEFSDVTISKIRFLESQGLIDPERTSSGYRKFYDGDIERLRYILREQKDNYLPLKVIKERLDGIDHTLPNPPRPVPTGASWATAPADDGSRPPQPPLRQDEPAIAPIDDERTTFEPDDRDHGLTVGREAVNGLHAGAGAEVAAARSAPAGPPSTEPAPAEREVVVTDVVRVTEVVETAFGADITESVLVVETAVPAEPHRPSVPAPPSVVEVATVVEAVPAPPPDPGPVTPPAPVPTAPPAAPVTSPGPPVLTVVGGHGSRSLPPADLQLSAEELCQRAGITAVTLRQLEEFGLVSGRAIGIDTTYGGPALRVAELAHRLLELGLEVRHLRTWRMAAEKEASLFEQLVLPMLRQRNPQARQHAVGTVVELAELGGELRELLVRHALSEYLER